MIIQAESANKSPDAFLTVAVVLGQQGPLHSGSYHDNLANDKTEFFSSYNRQNGKEK